jgi:pyruvate ferredoxin oxidoreductase delta subunit
MSKKEKNWKEIPIGGVITEAGNADKYETGSWRAYRPIRDKEKCINCLQCWIYCPDSAIKVKDGKMVEINLKHCKGCGLCAKQCPKKINAIKMVLESEADKK